MDTTQKKAKFPASWCLNFKEGKMQNKERRRNITLFQVLIIPSNDNWYSMNTSRQEDRESIFE